MTTTSDRKHLDPAPAAQTRPSESMDGFPTVRPDTSDFKPVEIEESSIRKSALRWFLLAMAVFLGWAFYAPIDAGVSAPGTVVVLGNRKAVQHPKGGVVQEIFTREGAVVKEGDVLLRINPLNTEADLISQELQYINLLANESRLLAERAGRSDIAWKPELERFGADPRAREVKAIQLQLLRSRLQDQRGQQEMIREQISGLQAQVEGLQELLKMRQAQLKILAEEAKNNRELADEGFVPRSRANEVARMQSETAGSVASTTADLAKTRTAIAAARLQIAQLKTNFLKEIDAQLSETQKSREALQSKVQSLRFDLSLTDLKAPVSGTVVGFKVNTIGGVIQAGQTLMEIVPQDERLIVEAKIQPTLIDRVRVGMEADMRFTAFNQTTTPVIPGHVKLLGADQVKPETAQEEGYFLAHVEVTPEGKRLLGSLAVQPGMPVDVIVKTGERTFMSYFIKPITDRFARAFKEQ